MLSFLLKSRAYNATINGVSIAVQPRETVLQAALRQGFDFPHSCRVGGCASCKCRLVEGRVRELTESSYILSDEELDAGYILACQSVPRSDVRIEVDLTCQPVARQVRGRVVIQQRLTHDITRLVIQLDESLAYQAGQYAEVTLDCLPAQTRSFSFASPSQAEAQVSFFIRKVPGGLFTEHVDKHSLVGQAVSVSGPKGDFVLSSEAGPLLLVAGGSGLAPLLAMLQDALEKGCQRQTSLLFGAREERDLYALEQINNIAAQWRAPFRFVPVLSEVKADASWRGAKGLITAQLAALLEPATEVYLCGPPAMIDSAVDLLKQHGVARERVHADRFTTQQDAQPLLV